MALAPQLSTDLVADTLQYNTVGWEGTDRLWRVQTRLAGGATGDKEIDIDDRQASLLVSIEMASAVDWDWKATNFKAVLEVNDTNPNENISLDDISTGPLVLFDHTLPSDPDEVFPGVSLQKLITVRTGLFSDNALNRQSASPGTKNYTIKLTYNLEPIVGSARQTVETKLIFYVASD